MRIKRCLAPLLVCLALSGCPHQAEDNTPEEEIPQEEAPEEETPEDESFRRFNPGTYTGQVPGYGGTLSLSTTFSEDAITNIVIDTHSESTGRPTVQTALTAIPLVIIKTQRLDVDGISGATRTSNAIKNAVEACVVKAGGFPADLKGAP
jgi:fumarate reductase flavoprotein subunit